MSSNVIISQNRQTPSNAPRELSNRPYSEFQAPSDDKNVVFSDSVNKINMLKVWVFFGLYFTMITVLLVFFFYFLFGHAVDQQRTYAVLNSVSKIMKEPPIADIYLATKECPLDFEKISIGEWPGIEHGCYYTQEKSVKIGNCNQEKQGLGVQSIPQEAVNSWEGYSFCIRKYHSMAIEYNEDCPYGFQKCGRYLCVPEQEKCPITTVNWIDDTPPKDSKDEIILVDYEKKRYVLVERSENREPLVEFTVSYNGMPCLDTNSMPFAEETYPLIKTKAGCHYGQNFEAVIINAKSEQKFLPELASYNLIKELPLIEDYSIKNKVYLVGLNRFRVRPDEACSNPEQFFIMGRVHDEAEQITKLRTLFLIAVLFGIVIILFLGCDQRKMSLGLASIDLSMREKNGLFIFILCVLLSLLTGCCLLIVRPKVGLIASYRDSLELYSRYNCFMNSFITTALTDFSNGPPYEAELFYKLILGIFCLSLLPILLIIYEKCRQKPNKQILLKNPDEED